LTPDNFAIARGLPAKAKFVLQAGMSLPHGSLTARLPDGRTIRMGGNGPGPDAVLVLNNWNLPGRAFSGGTIGVAESYMDGDWESPDVTTFLELFVINREAGERVAGGANWLIMTIQRIRHWFNDNTKAGSKRNISAHYDLGNEFYKQWLDPSMTYSSALYQTGATTWNRRRPQIPGAGARHRHRPERPCAGDRLRLGRLRRIRGARDRLQGDRADHQPRAACLCAASASPRPGCPTRSNSSSRTIATRPARTTASPRSRCSRRSAKNTGRCSSAR
jgi:hypothetical protein